MHPEDNFNLFARLVGCHEKQHEDATLACLRACPLETFFGNRSLLPIIANTSQDALFSPLVDGVEFSDTPEVLAAKGQINSVQGVMLGSNLNEGRLLMPFQMPVPGAPLTTKAQFKEWLQSQFSVSVTAAIMARYPVSEYRNSYWQTASKVFTDSQYTCPTRRSARWLIQSGRVPPGQVFAYQLRYEAVVYGLLGDVVYWWEWCQDLNLCRNATRFPIGVGHAADVILVWNSRSLLSSNDHLVSRHMVDWWHTFATNYTPNGVHNLPTKSWPPFRDDNQTMLVQPQPEPVSNVREEICNFWDQAHPVPYKSDAQHNAALLV
jgi:hypothetical protein